MHRSDAELLAASRGGDAEAFGEFYRRYVALVIAYFARRVSSPELAADLMMETFAAALLSLSKAASPPPDPPAWLFSIASNKLIDSRRRGGAARRARNRLALERVDLDDHELRRVESSGSAERVEQLLAPLPEAQAAALRARILEDLSYAEIEGLTGVSQQLLRKRVSRALRALRASTKEAP